MDDNNKIDKDTILKHVFMSEQWRTLDGDITQEVFRNSAGQLDHGSLPSRIDYHLETGKKASILYHREGQLHREGDQPAETHYWEDGGIQNQAWYKNGKLHRDGGLPAEIDYWEDGTLMSQDWYQNGKPHRDHGLPAKVTYNEAGKIERQRFYENGVEIGRTIGGQEANQASKPANFAWKIDPS